MIYLSRSWITVRRSTVRASSCKRWYDSATAPFEESIPTPRKLPTVGSDPGIRPGAARPFQPEIGLLSCVEPRLKIQDTRHLKIPFLDSFIRDPCSPHSGRVGRRNAIPHNDNAIRRVATRLQADRSLAKKIKRLDCFPLADGKPFDSEAAHQATRRTLFRTNDRLRSLERPCFDDHNRTNGVRNHALSRAS
jgi:hypothetical protein